MKIIYKVIGGSRAYGTANQLSDTDIYGIYLPTIDECLSLKKLSDIREKTENTDKVIFPIQKFFRLALASNPSVFEWLFVQGKNILEMTEEGKMIRDNRLMFLSKEMYHRFKGYAWSEFSSLTKLTGDTGDKRKQQILKYGYSPKNAMNMIRLLSQGIELLTTANLTLPRPEREMLLEIKNGELKYKQLSSRFNELVLDLDKALEESLLPDKTRFEDANNLMVNIIKK